MVGKGLSPGHQIPQDLAIISHQLKNNTTICLYNHNVFNEIDADKVIVIWNAGKLTYVQSKQLKSKHDNKSDNNEIGANTLYLHYVNINIKLLV